MRAPDARDWYPPVLRRISDEGWQGAVADVKLEVVEESEAGLHGADAPLIWAQMDEDLVHDVGFGGVSLWVVRLDGHSYGPTGLRKVGQAGVRIGPGDDAAGQHRGWERLD